MLPSRITPLSNTLLTQVHARSSDSSAVAAAAERHKDSCCVRSARSAEEVAATAGGRRRGVRILWRRGAHKPLDDGDASQHAVQALREGRCLRLRLRAARVLHVGRARVLHMKTSTVSQSCCRGLQGRQNAPCAAPQLIPRVH